MAPHGEQHCVEHGVWTPVGGKVPQDLVLKLHDVDSAEAQRVEGAAVMSFHLTGCSGDYTDHSAQNAVAGAMVAQFHRAPGPDSAPTPSFLYHLGDIVYKLEDTGSTDDSIDSVETGGDEYNILSQMYADQFYRPYSTYPRSIFAVPGNHDGKVAKHDEKSNLAHYLRNFCSTDGTVSSDNSVDSRPAGAQPYVYWCLDTPLAYVIGLYSNVANGGILDDPAGRVDGEQYRWLVDRLGHIRQANEGRTSRRAILLMVHYPPYSGATNFALRGDPTLGPTGARHAQPLGAVLNRAFAESGQRPDAVFSAHAHLYQRLTYRYADGWELPYLVAGSGGHTPVESMWKACEGGAGPARTAPFGAVFPPGGEPANGDEVQVEAFDDEHFGFMRVTCDGARLTGEFFAAGGTGPEGGDSFVLDLATHRLVAGGEGPMSG